MSMKQIAPFLLVAALSACGRLLHCIAQPPEHFNFFKVKML